MFKSIRLLIVLCVVLSVVSCGFSSVSAQEPDLRTPITLENTNLVPIITFDLNTISSQQIFSSDGRLLMVDGQIRGWDIVTGVEIRVNDVIADVFVPVITMCPDGNAYAITLVDNDGYFIIIIDMETQEGTGRQDKRDGRTPTSMAFSPDCSQLIYADNLVEQDSELPDFVRASQGVIHIVDLDDIGPRQRETPVEEVIIENQDAVIGPIFFSPDGTTIVYSTIVTGIELDDDAGHGQIHFIDYETGNEIRILDSGNMIAEAIDPTWDKIVLSDRMMFFGLNGYLGDVFTMLSLNTGQPLPLDLDGVFSGSRGSLGGATFSPDGSIIAAVSIDRQLYSHTHPAALYLWSANTGEQLARFDLGTIVFARPTFSPDGLWLALYIQRDDSHGQIQLWGPLLPGTCSISALNNSNLRGGPGTNHETAGTMAAGETGYVDGQANDASGYVWWRLMGRNMWIRSDLVEADNNCEDVPLVE